MAIFFPRDDGAPERLHYWKPFLGKKLLELSIGGDFGARKGVNPKSSEHPLYLDFVVVLPWKPNKA